MRCDNCINMTTVPKQIAERFLEKLAETKAVDGEQIEKIRDLLMEGKKLKAEDLVKIFSLPAGGDLK